MMDLKDEYLTAFFQDVKGVGSAISTVIQFLLGISYVAGKYLTEAITGTLGFIWYSLVQSKLLAEALVEALVDIWSAVFHGVLLLYYGVGKIIEAFQITILDLLTFISNIFNFIIQLGVSGAELFVQALSMLTIIPSQLNATLGLVGDLSISLLKQTFFVLQHFVTTLIWSPFYAISVFLSWVWMLCVQIPKAIVHSADKITLSAIIGLVVLLLTGYLYSKLSFVQFLQRTWHYSLIAGRRTGLFFVTAYKKIKSKLKIRRRLVEEADEDFDDEDGELTKGICVICQVNHVCYISSPCNHVCLCNDCVHRLVEYSNRCPMCRKVVEYFSRVYIS